MRLFNRRRVLSRRHWAGYGVAGSVLTPLPGTQLAEGIRGVPLKTDPLSELRQNPLVTDIQEKIEIDKEGDKSAAFSESLDLVSEDLAFVSDVFALVSDDFAFVSEVFALVS